jgi:hypothetical protein
MSIKVKRKKDEGKKNSACPDTRPVDTRKTATQNCSACAELKGVLGQLPRSSKKARKIVNINCFSSIFSENLRKTYER